MHLRSRAFVLGAVLAITPVLGGACGGSSLEKVDADDWVADVCDAALDFQDDFLDAAGGLDVIEDGDPDEIKDAVDEWVDEGSDAIDAFVKDVEDVGQPDIDGGADVIKAFRAHAKKQKEILADFKKDVNKLDDDDDEDFRDGVFDILDDVEDPDFREELEDIDENDVDDLIDQIDDEPDCASVLFN